MATCKCENGLSNTGVAACSPIMGVTRAMFLVNTYDSSGQRNFIDLSTAVGNAYLQTKINDTDKSKRWYPLTELNNVSQAIEDTVFDEASNGIKYFVRGGKRSISAEIWGVSEQAISKLSNNRCSTVSAYLVDVKGQLIGMYRGDDETKLYPIDISQDSWDAKPMPATDSTVSKGMITFDWAFNDVANQDKLRILNGSIVTADFLNVIGLIDVSVKVGAITSTSVTFTAMIENGSTSKIPLQGLTLTDILLNEPPAILQLATAIAPTSTVGQYIITMPSQTTADTLKLSISKNGFDFGTSKTVVIP